MKDSMKNSKFIKYQASISSLGPTFFYLRQAQKRTSASSSLYCQMMRKCEYPALVLRKHGFFMHGNYNDDNVAPTLVLHHLSGATVSIISNGYLPYDEVKVTALAAACQETLSSLEKLASSLKLPLVEQTQVERDNQGF